MKLAKILKNKKAMTPIMIGIIVAASVVAVIFIVMAAVIPFIKHDVEMYVAPRTIMANSSDNTALRFDVTCDYAPGVLYKIEILQDQTVYGVVDNLDLSLENREVREIGTTFDATANAPAGEVSGGLLVFQNGEAYTMKLYYRSPDGSSEGTSTSTWTYAAFES
ncbi:MAG: hypothetical protein GF308_12330 [Candidatus Heimdallarchaeota archaeon]|nr:hypothetical protein [Candidatus Heimdallarchaeota archaeon]